MPTMMPTSNSRRGRSTGRYTVWPPTTRVGKRAVSKTTLMRIGLMTPAPAVKTTNPAMAARPPRWALKSPAVCRTSRRFDTRPDGLSRLRPPPIQPPPWIIGALQHRRGSMVSSIRLYQGQFDFPIGRAGRDAAWRGLSSARFGAEGALAHRGRRADDQEYLDSGGHFGRRSCRDRRLRWFVGYDADADGIVRRVHHPDDPRARQWLERQCERELAARCHRRAEHQPRTERGGGEG